MFKFLNLLTQAQEPANESFGEQISQFFRDLWAQVSDGALWGNIFTRILIVIIVIIVGHFLIKAILGILGGFLKINKKRRDPSVNRFIVNVVSFVLRFLLVIAVIAILGIPLTGLANVISSAILAIGLSLQDTVANFAAGVQILSTKPFATGDWVEIAGVSGSVTDVDLMTTSLKSATGQKVIIPNKTVMNNHKINYGFYPTRQARIEIAFPEETVIEPLRDVILDMVRADSRVLDEPAVQFVVTGFGENQINTQLRYWTLTGDFWDVQFEFNDKIAKYLQENGYVFSYFKHSVILEK
ncbi:MAG: mechanosensitive ion channel family protein [Erysipelotrichaceae bacterium]|nr:mechanosensitive ion channel family protein [Erysipelotrichaceae bacterium]